MYITLFMRKYLKNRFADIATLLCAGFVFFALLGACTKVDNRVGSGILPLNQQMEIEMKTISNGVKTYLFKEDSIPSSRLGYAYFGRMNDATGVFGAQTSSVIVQFLPITLPYTERDGYGIEPIIDSMCILLSLNDVRGDTTKTQTFDVYNVVKNETRGVLDRSNTYYNNFPISEYRGEKLFSFSHTGRRSVRAKLFPTDAGKRYLESIVDIEDTTWEIFKDDSLFRAKFQGLYITPAEGSEPNAAVYSADLSASGLMLYVRNHDTLDVTAIYDTIVSPFSFMDNDTSDSSTGATSSWDNVSVNMTSFDYSGSTFASAINDTLPASPTQRSAYIQTMAGVGTYLRFTDELIDRIRGLGGEENVDIMINRALMQIYLDGNVDDYKVLDNSLARLGSYSIMKYLYPIPDYQYTSEVAYQAQDATYRLPYNGWLNRSNGYYELDITSYIQQLAKKRDGDPGYRRIPPVVFLAPEAYSLYGFGSTTLRGYDSTKETATMYDINDTSAETLEQMQDIKNNRLITIKLTYTIIKGKPTQDE